MADEAVWRRRFLVFSAIRLSGLAVFFVGFASIFTDLLRPGGWPVAGGLLAVLGLAISLMTPKLLKTQWEREDRSAGDRPGEGRTD
jgi:hypothetical protein